jgi:hypothetical protein
MIENAVPTQALAHLSGFLEPSVFEPNWLTPITIWQTVNLFPTITFKVTIQWDTKFGKRDRLLRIYLGKSSGEYVLFQWRNERFRTKYSDGSFGDWRNKQTYIGEGREYDNLADAAYQLLKARGVLNAR